MIEVWSTGIPRGFRVYSPDVKVVEALIVTGAVPPLNDLEPREPSVARTAEP